MPSKTTHQIASSLGKLARPIGSITADPRNARSHDTKSLDAIKASLTRFGQQKAIVVDRQGVVVAGNGTLEAARLLGWTHLAVAETDLAESERAAYAIADNRTAELSAWDATNLREITSGFTDDQLAATGFTPQQLHAAIAAAEDAEEMPDIAGVAAAAPAVASRGDIYVLGEHRLLCGDSTSRDDVQRVMGGDKAKLVATDPPYLVDYTGVRAGDRGKDWSASYHEVDIPDAGRFFRLLFANALEVMDEHAAIYCWHAHKRAPEIVGIWREMGILDHQQIIWVKPTTVFGSVFWHFRHEPCLMGWRQGSKPWHDGRHDHSSVWIVGGGAAQLDEMTREQLVELIKAQTSVWEIDFDGKSRMIGNEHPTQKPLEIFARPMRKHTKRGDIVYEPFSGSGSQLIAAEQLGRRCRAIEYEPVFVDVAIRRWQKLTGLQAKRESDGARWADLASRLVPTGARKPKSGTPPCPASPRTLADAPAAQTSRKPGTAPTTKGNGKPASARDGAPPKARRPAAATARRGAASER